MIYRTSKLMFRELSVALGSKQFPATEKTVIAYMNQTFNLKQEITELRLV